MEKNSKSLELSFSRLLDFVSRLLDLVSRLLDWGLRIENFAKSGGGHLIPVAFVRFVFVFKLLVSGEKSINLIEAFIHVTFRML